MQATVESGGDPGQGTPLRVLLVEDSAVLAARLEELLTQVPRVVLTGTVDAETSAIGAIQTGEVDVVILDLHLRQGTGFGVLRGTARMLRRPVFVVLTNYAVPQYRHSAAALGVEFFLDKALEYDRLPDVLGTIARSVDARSH